MVRLRWPFAHPVESLVPRPLNGSQRCGRLRLVHVLLEAFRIADTATSALKGECRMKLMENMCCNLSNGVPQSFVVWPGCPWQ